MILLFKKNPGQYTGRTYNRLNQNDAKDRWEIDFKSKTIILLNL